MCWRDEGGDQEVGPGACMRDWAPAFGCAPGAGVVAGLRGGEVEGWERTPRGNDAVVVWRCPGGQWCGGGGGTDLLSGRGKVSRGEGRLVGGVLGVGTIYLPQGWEEAMAGSGKPRVGKGVPPGRGASLQSALGAHEVPGKRGANGQAGVCEGMCRVVWGGVDLDGCVGGGTGLSVWMVVQWNGRGPWAGSLPHESEAEGLQIERVL